MKDKDFYARYTEKILKTDHHPSEDGKESAANDLTANEEDEDVMEGEIKGTDNDSAHDFWQNGTHFPEILEDQESEKTELESVESEKAESETSDTDNNQWYVVQTMSGKEEILIKYIDACIDKSYISECFVPKRERKKKINQRWRVITEKIFKGYVFIVTPSSEKVFFALKNIPLLSKLLGDGEFTFIPLTEREIDFVSRIGSGRPDHTAKISTIEFGEGDEVLYMQGDIVAFEGMVKKFDKHRRKAIVETEMFGRKTEVWLEFEFLRKK